MAARKNPARRLRGESGQVIALFAISLVALVGMVGLVIDVGHAYYVQRSLQRSADAAALAGAGDLPNVTQATTTATSYGATGSGANSTSTLGAVTEKVTTKCLTSIPGCNPVNAVQVDETMTVPTLFLKALGFSTFTIHSRSVACAPCGARPLDVMLVLDRTGSMCMNAARTQSDPACTDLNSARQGMQTFLKLMDPSQDHVGLALLPPALRGACTTPSSPYYQSSTDPYVVVPLSSDYLKPNGALNTSSSLVSTLNCVKGAGSTSYANALEAAQAELNAHGRPNVQKLILLFSDGAANTGPTSYPTSSPYRTQPCHQGIASAATAKSRGTLVYSVGYDLNASGSGGNVCQSYTGSLESPSITAYQALQLIASGPAQFYNQPTSSDLTALFQQVAYDVNKGSSKLVSNDAQ